MKIDDPRLDLSSGSGVAPNGAARAARRGRERVHAGAAMLTSQFLRGRLFLDLRRTSNFLQRNRLRARLSLGVFCLYVFAIVHSVGAFGLGWLALRCYPTITPWLVETSGLPLSEMRWAAILGSIAVLTVIARVLSEPKLLFRTLSNWATLVAGPAIVMYGASNWLPSGRLDQTGITELVHLLELGLLCVIVGFMPQIGALAMTAIACVAAAALFWSYGPLRSWLVYARELTRWTNVPPLQALALILGGMSGGLVGGMVFVSVLINVIGNSSPLMGRILDAAPSIFTGCIAAGGAGFALYAFALGFRDRIRGDNGWVFAGADRDRPLANVVVQAIGRGATRCVTAVVELLFSTLKELWPEGIGAFIFIFFLVLLSAFWNAIGASIWAEVSKSVSEHRALYSLIVLFGAFSMLLVSLGGVALRRKRGRSDLP